MTAESTFREVVALLRSRKDLKCDVDCLDEPFVTKFARVRDNDPDKTAELIAGYFKMRAEHPECFTPLAECPLAKDILRKGIFRHGRQRTPSGEVIIYADMSRTDPKNFLPWEVLKGSIVMSEYIALDAKDGMVEIQDMAGVGFKHLWATPPSFPKLTSDLSERALPVNFRKVHIVNESRIVDIFYSLMKPFLSKDFTERLIFHGTNYDQLVDMVGADVVPETLGGTLKTDGDFYTDDELEHMDKIVTDLWTRYPVKIEKT